MHKFNTAIVLTIAVLIGAALFYVRFVSDEFVLGTNTFTHPYKSFAGALIAGGLIWMMLIPLFKRMPQLSKAIIWAVIGLGVVFRLMFMGSTPIYEDDWNRYLWDGVVTTQGVNPYEFPPSITQVDIENPSDDVMVLQKLAQENENFPRRINNAHLTTIYPPVAMSVFTVSAIISPLNLDVLRGLYLGIELIALWLLLKTLRVYGKESYWALLYWVNPMLIYSVYNAAHMDIILVPFLIGALLLVKTRPFLASFVLGLAAAVKIWPLILGPVLLRDHRKSLPIFLGGGFIMGITALVLLSPMLLSLSEHSGLQAYAGGWQRSSFLFVHLENILAFAGEKAGLIARIVVAGIITILSLWLTFRQDSVETKLPGYLLIVPLWLYIISPTGYPWYVLWFLPFLPFLPLYGGALLTVTVALYYVRYGLGERDNYEFYTSVLIPLQFGLPIVLLIAEGLFLRKTANA